MEEGNSTPKTYKVSVKYIVYILLFLVLVLLTISLSLGYFLLNAQKNFENSVNSSVSASLLASKQNESEKSNISTEVSTITTSNEEVSKVVFATNTGTFVAFDYPEGGIISIESVNADNKFTSVEDIKYVHLKGDFYEVTVSKNKLVSLNQSTVGERLEYHVATLDTNCKYLTKSVSLDKVVDEILCDDTKQVVKSRLLNPGFSYHKSKPLILYANSTDASMTVIPFTAFGSPLGMREIISVENSINNPSKNIVLQNMPSSWMNSAYYEFRCNNISDESIAINCIEIFTTFIDSFEFRK